MEEIIELIKSKLVGLLFSAISVFLGAKINSLNNKIKQSHAEQDALKLGMQALLRNEIIQIYNSCCDKGYIPIYELENVESLYVNYHNLGGNGVVTEIIEKIHKLPNREVDE